MARMFWILFRRGWSCYRIRLLYYNRFRHRFRSFLYWRRRSFQGLFQFAQSSRQYLYWNSVFAPDDLEEDRFEGDALRGAFLEGGLSMDQEIENIEGLRLCVRCLFLESFEEGGPIVFDELIEKMGEVLAGLEELVDEFEGEGESTFGEGIVERGEKLLGNKAERLADDGGGDGVFGKAEDLVEERFGIAQSAFGEMGDEGEGFWFDSASLGRCAIAGEFVRRCASGRMRREVEALAAADDGREDFVGLGGGEEKFDIGGRLFEGFEKRVEGLFGEHVHFVDDVDLVACQDEGRSRRSR